ncbi:hypothetical protein [Arthrobacter sp. MMS18-M83]|uniref:hypothetical protein n=1 Tax=Arthrobacter sp. MMS18-M83 TaxID=2996261 RepID=UPI00227A4C7C|nr:hypothetical protein [Arthrobacter sp. MMS18-M83]WAH99746.1 hypothetical protein OW521_24095 [Arthrobacter sp. MMS18-M83]
MSPLAITTLVVVLGTAALVWFVNRDRMKPFASRWPATFLITSFGAPLSLLLTVEIIPLDRQTKDVIGMVLLCAWALYLIGGIIGCFFAWAHPQRVARREFRAALARGEILPYPLLSPEGVVKRAAFICGALFMIIFGIMLTSTAPASIESSPFVYTVGIPCVYGCIAVVAGAWFIQSRRVKRRDADYESAIENHHRNLAAEASAAYRNGFDDGQSKSSITT